MVAYVGNVGRDRRAEATARTSTSCGARRSTGSILKPFLYAAMLQEGGLTPAHPGRRHAGPLRAATCRRTSTAASAAPCRPRDALAWSLNMPGRAHAAAVRHPALLQPAEAVGHDHARPAARATTG
ncbi:MAG: hypothetical protein MZV64_33820 [Ignavibacteriales bacterium]|nr:hypothetical protein [Ignavibacteriales bacterium]